MQPRPSSSSETLRTPSSEVWLYTSWQTRWLRGRGDWTRQSLKTSPNFSIQQPSQGKDMPVISTVCGASLANTGATLELTPESAVLHTNNHHLSWPQRKRAFQVLKEVIGARHLSAIKRSTDQGQAFDSLSLHPDSPYFTYTGAFLSFYQYRFVHKARLNLLPVRTVQARCRKLVPSTQCRHCGRAEETLAHILNHCHQHLGMVRERHNAVLDRIERAVPAHLGTKMKEQAIQEHQGPTDLT